MMLPSGIKDTIDSIISSTMIPTKIGKLKITIKIAAKGIRGLVINTSSQEMPISKRMGISIRYGANHLILQLGSNRI
jgi:hypothetical protein